MTERKKTGLSIIVPVLNENNVLAALLENLARQRGIKFEVIFCDGGSTDGTLNVISENAAGAPFPVHLVRTAAGRGRQMNAGAAVSRAEWLLFLHADSSFDDPLALMLGVEALRAEGETTADFRMAGHFALRFDRFHDPAYRFFETKARLNRPGCIHGDQGFLISKNFFQNLGGYREDLPIMEDEELSDAIFAGGRWILLPAEINTSTRRFDKEGFFERQVLNALLMNFHHIGWSPFFVEAAGVYRQQRECGRLDLLPFFDEVARLLRRENWRRRIGLWWRTGAYVNGNAWQLALFLDVRRWVKRGPPPPVKETPCLEIYDCRFRFLVENVFGTGAGAVLTWGWFHLFRRILRGRKLVNRCQKGYIGKVTGLNRNEKKGEKL